MTTAELIQEACELDGEYVEPMVTSLVVHQHWDIDAADYWDGMYIRMLGNEFTLAEAKLLSVHLIEALAKVERMISEA